MKRVENKLDELQKAIVSLARVEERLTTVFNRQTKIDEKVSSIESELIKISNKVNSAFTERLFWIIVVALVTFATKQL